MPLPLQRLLRIVRFIAENTSQLEMGTSESKRNKHMSSFATRETFSFVLMLTGCMLLFYLKCRAETRVGVWRMKGRTPEVTLSALKLRSSKPCTEVSSPPQTFTCLIAHIQRGAGPKEDLQVSTLRCVPLLPPPLRAWLWSEAGWLESYCFSLQD